MFLNLPLRSLRYFFLIPFGSISTKKPVTVRMALLKRYDTRVLTRRLDTRNTAPAALAASIIAVNVFWSIVTTHGTILPQSHTTGIPMSRARKTIPVLPSGRSQNDLIWLLGEFGISRSLQIQNDFALLLFEIMLKGCCGRLEHLAAILDCRTLGLDFLTQLFELFTKTPLLILETADLLVDFRNLRVDLPSP